ncbi:hypothetical protein BZG10_06900, partial [Salinivibrio kushneri]
MVKQGCRTGWLAGCLLLLVGCTTELAYNTLPFWIHYYIDDIVNLRPEQSRQVKADLDKIQQWHRTHELPAIAERLGLIATQSTERQTMAQLRAHQDSTMAPHSRITGDCRALRTDRHTKYRAADDGAVACAS